MYSIIYLVGRIFGGYCIGNQAGKTRYRKYQISGPSLIQTRYKKKKVNPPSLNKAKVNGEQGFSFWLSAHHISWARQISRDDRPCRIFSKTFLWTLFFINFGPDQRVLDRRRLLYIVESRKGGGRGVEHPPPPEENIFLCAGGLNYCCLNSGTHERF